MEASGKGTARVGPSGDIEFIQLNPTDPWNEVDGERASVKSRHFAFSDPKVRGAMALLCDRKGMQDFVYGRTGTASGHFISAPARYRSPNAKWEFNVDKANALLDDAGCKRGADGIREKGGRKMKFVFQTSINGTRQKEQAIVKQAAQKAGIELELKSVAPSVFFSSDVGNPDTYPHFYCDLQMYTTTMTEPDPALFMNQFCSWEAATKENKWQGRNITRWRNDEYDKAYRAAEGELNPVKRALLFIKMNELVIADVADIPVVYRPAVRALHSKLKAPLSGWDNDMYQIAEWYREA